MSKASVVKSNSSKGSGPAQEKLAAYKADKLRKKQARLEEMHKQFPALYSKPPPLSAQNDRLAPTMSRILSLYPTSVGSVNDENSLPKPSSKSSISSSGKSVSLVRKLFGGGNKKKAKSDSNEQSASRKVLSPKRDTSNIIPSNINSEEDEVQDVLDYLLEEHQVTPAVYRRISAQRLTLNGIQHRLTIIPNSEPDTVVLEAVQQYIMQVQNSWDSDMAAYFAANRSTPEKLDTLDEEITVVPTVEANLGETVHINVCDDTYALSTQCQVMEPKSFQPFESLRVEYANAPQLNSLSGGGTRNHNLSSARFNIGMQRNAGDFGDEYQGENENFFDDDEGKDGPEDEEDSRFESVGLDSALQNNLLRKCLDWYLRQGAVKLSVDSFVLRTSDSSGSSRAVDDADGGDGKEYVAYEVRMSSGGHMMASSSVPSSSSPVRGSNISPNSSSAKGFKMMLLKRYSDFENLYELLKKAFAYENVKNVAGSSVGQKAYYAAKAINQTYSDAIKMSSSSYGLPHTNLLGVSYSKGGRLELALPPLPPKQRISSFGRWKDRTFLENRQKQLGEWLAAILPLQTYHTTNAVPVHISINNSAGNNPNNVSPNKRALDNKVRQAFRIFLLPEHALKYE
jgi:hypothetical protein